ncbi:MAG: hypothetical protein ABJB86_03650 [Bacteroidota bacterium]
MKYRANFKTIILVHLAGIIILGLWSSFAGSEKATVVLRWITGAIFVSCALQLFIYTIKPKWFANKTTDHPEQP